MPRPPRIQFEGADYHFYTRGNRRERIFCGEDDYSAFEDMMLEAMRWSGVELYNWSQMPNHVHLHLLLRGSDTQQEIIAIAGTERIILQ